MGGETGTVKGINEGEKKREKRDLKKGHVKPLSECTQSHQGALDRTRAEFCTVCGGAIVCARAHNGSVLERASMCARSHSCVCLCLGSSVQIVRSSPECNNKI